MNDNQLPDVVNSIDANQETIPVLEKQFLTRPGIVPFVGAGLSVPMGFPQWSEFLLEVAGRSTKANLVQEIKDQIAVAEYEEAASKLLEALGPRRFQDLLAHKFGGETDEIIATKQLGGAVAELPKFPSGPIFTTNFDRVLEAVFKKAGKPIDAYWHSQASMGSEALQQGRPFLLKLHGDWSDQSTRVLTLEEYKEAYGDIDGNRYRIKFARPLPALLNSLLASRCCLFLGCSLGNDRTIGILRAISRQFAGMVHYAIVEQPAGDDEFARRSADLSALGIRPVWYPHQRHDLIRPILAYFAMRAAQSLPTTPTRGRGAARSKKIIPNNIPDPGNVTIGRKEELHLLVDMLRGARLISITGAGGCGKSRLAIELANKIKNRFSDGVWFIPLADLDKKADHERILPTRVGRIIGVPEKAGRPPNEALAEHLSKGTYLLIFDNCEHLLDSCKETITYLLRTCPNLTVVTTSRAVLKLSMERLLPIAPLAAPPPGDKNLGDIERSPAVQLFVERVRQRWPEYKLDIGSAPDVAELCRTLDGIPLAIEIAAARIAVKSVEEINRESQHLLAAIGNIESGDALRWNTLTAALQWSYGLLDSNEQSFMASLSIFDGGWTAAAAEAVYRGASSDRTPVVDHLQLLYESSLVTSAATGSSKRFRFLEPIRQFAELQLSPEKREGYQQRHAEFFLKSAEEGAAEVLKSHQLDWLDRLQDDVDNFRAALRWSVECQQAEIGLRLVNALWRFVEIRGYFTEGRKRAQEVLNIPGSEQFREYRSKALSGAGMLAYRQADYKAAQGYFREALELEEQANYAPGIANSLTDLGNVARMKGEYTLSRELASRSLQIEEQSNNQRGIAVGHFNLGSVALAVGEYDESQRHFAESLAGFREAGNAWESGFPLNGLALVAIAKSDLPLAEGYAHDSLSVRLEAKDTRGQAEAQRTLAWVAISQRESKKAKELLSECMKACRGVGDQRGIAETLELFALLCFHDQAFKSAASLYAAFEEMREGFSYSLPKFRIDQRTKTLSRLREALGETEYDRAWRHGNSLSLQAAVDMALHVERELEAGTSDLSSAGLA